jgi:uncharacterized protein
MNTAARPWAEQGLVFGCAGEQLVGVLCGPAAAHAASDVGIVVVVGGPQYRAGSHRHFVALARALAEQGHTTLRFDVRGMGDSSGTQRSFEALDDDIAAAVDHLLAERPALRRIVLWGLCDGASAALLYCHRRADARVHALCLLNPWVRSPESLARAHVKHYYAQRLRQPEFWRKLLRGGVLRRAAADLAANLRLARGMGSTAAAQLPFQDQMAAAWHAFAGSILLALSERDYTAKEFIETLATRSSWQRALAHPRAVRHDIDADHTFSEPAGALALQRAIIDWLAGLGQPVPAAAAATRGTS